MITLHWIKKSPVKLDVFGEVQELTKEMEWRHVETKCNPGDIISRGINAGELVRNQLWWHGPDRLTKSKPDWPDSKLVLTEADVKTVRCHERKNALISVAIRSQPVDPITNNAGNLSQQWSDWNKLVRITGYVLRFINNARVKTNRKNGFLDINEKLKAEELWIKHSQSFRKRNRSYWQK